MSDRFIRLLQSRPYLLADGATGTNLFAMGLNFGEAPEIWNTEYPDLDTVVARLGEVSNGARAQRRGEMDLTQGVAPSARRRRRYR